MTLPLLLCFSASLREDFRGPVYPGLIFWFILVKLNLLLLRAFLLIFAGERQGVRSRLLSAGRLLPPGRVPTGPDYCQPGARRGLDYTNLKDIDMKTQEETPGCTRGEQDESKQPPPGTSRGARNDRLTHNGTEPGNDRLTIEGPERCSGPSLSKWLPLLLAYENREAVKINL